MADTEKLQRRFDLLLTDFLHPLLHGKTVELGQAIAPGAAPYFRQAHGSDHAIDREIFDALHREAAVLAPLKTVAFPDGDLAILAAAAHNLVMLTDPSLDRVFARGARETIAEWIDALLEAVRPPRTRSSAASRHALMGAVLALRREDVVVTNWAYTYRFYGRPVPANVTALPSVRRVKEKRTLHPLGKLLAAVDEGSELDLVRRRRALISRSPVTELLRLDLCPEFVFSQATLAVISDAGLRGGIASHIVERGECKAAPAFGSALRAPALKEAPIPLLRLALELIFEVQLTACLDGPGTGLPRRKVVRDGDTARYAAVLPAFFEDYEALDDVRDFDLRDRALIQQRADTLRRQIVPGIFGEVLELVERAFPSDQREHPWAPPAPAAQGDPRFNP